MVPFFHRPVARNYGCAADAAPSPWTSCPRIPLAIMEQVTGNCSSCLAPLKWAEIQHIEFPDGTRTATRLFV
jgi:hypothetical protein